MRTQIEKKNACSDKTHFPFSPVDCKRLNSGSFDQYLGDDFNSKQGNLYTNRDRECGGDYNRNPWGPSENQEPAHLGDDPLHMEENAEISSLRQQLEQLSKEENLLKKRTEANDLRRLVAEKKKSVAALRGNTNRGSYMSAHVLLNLLNELGKRDKMPGFPSNLSFFKPPKELWEA